MICQTWPSTNGAHSWSGDRMNEFYSPVCQNANDDEQKVNSLAWCKWYFACMPSIEGHKRARFYFTAVLRVTPTLNNDYAL